MISVEIDEVIRLGSSLSSIQTQVEGFSLPAGRQGLTLHFDRLSVLSLQKVAAFLSPSSEDGLCCRMAHKPPWSSSGRERKSAPTVSHI